MRDRDREGAWQVKKKKQLTYQKNTVAKQMKTVAKYFTMKFKKSSKPYPFQKSIKKRFKSYCNIQRDNGRRYDVFL